MPWYFIKTSLLFLLWVGQEAAFAQHLSWRNFTADQGLPGNIVYDMLEDRHGYLWFVTDQGICRFNGYEFIQPTDTSAMRGSEAFVPTEDATGKIWFARLDGSVWFIQNDTVRAWKYNEVTASFRRKFRPIEALAVDGQGAVWMAIFDLGILKVDKNGIIEVTSSSEADKLIFSEVRGKIIYSSQRMQAIPTGYPPAHQRRMSVFQYADGSLHYLQHFPVLNPVHHTERGIWKLSSGDWIYCYKGVFYLIGDQKVIWKSAQGIQAEIIKETPEGALLIAAHWGPNAGLFYFASKEHLKKGIYKNLLPDHHVTDFCMDHEGGWWATTHHAGVFYCKNPSIEVFDIKAGLPAEEVLSLTSDGISKLYAGFRSRDVAFINYRNGRMGILPRPSVSARGVEVLDFDTRTQRLWCSNPLYFWENQQWNATEWYDPYIQWRGQVQAKTIAQDISGQNIWTSSSQGFFRIDNKTNEAFYLGGKSETAPFMRTFSVTPDAGGNVWITTPQGLKLWRNGDYESPPFDHPALKYQPRGVALLPGGSMVISLRSAGLLIRTGQGAFTHLTVRDGLSSDFITKLYCSNDGKILACSYAGLNFISMNRDGNWEITIIDKKKGLPSNHVNDALLIGTDIWVATEKGLACFRNLPAPSPMPSPVLEKLLVNNQNAVFAPVLRLAHDENNLSIRFFALHYRSDGDIPYRYRLLGADTAFVYTHNRVVNFANLSPDAYTFEVQAQNEAGQWSAPTRWTFEVRTAWWQTRWFRVSVILILVLGFGLWYSSYLRKARRDTEVRNKIRDLEAAALRAQMNPHFIFNCLGSIQHFISENDAASATRFLSRFARLVRLALHGSVDGRHSLREEMEMLENYLMLEQLRFRGKFSFTIEAAPEIDPEDTFLPPMLVQPFVENALLHGLKNKVEGGRISIAFSQNDGFLLATVTDNGPGFAPDDKNLSETGHKSIGMTLTQRRLEILAEQRGQEALLRENILAGDGTIQGMRVVLQVPLG
ncbi:MAG: histidine kinase [Saprospiraceae bacterium]|nr:histidine kinase [Saprospiraceae bacterium]